MRYLTRWMAALAMIAAGLTGAVAAAPAAYATAYCSSYQSLCWHISASPPSTMPTPVPGQDFAINVDSYATGASAGAPPIPTSDFIVVYYGFGSSCTGSQLYIDWLSGGSPSGSGCSQASSPGCTAGVAQCTAQIPIPSGETQPLNYEAWALDSAHGDVMEYCSNAGSITVGIAPQVILASTFGSGTVTVSSGTPVELQANVTQGAVAPALYVCDQTTQRYESATPSTSSSPFVGVHHTSGSYTYYAFASDKGGLQGTVCANTRYPPNGWANQGLSNPVTVTWNPPTTAATASLTANGQSGTVYVTNGTQVSLVGRVSNTLGANATYLCAQFNGYFLGAIPVSPTGTSPVTMNATTVGHSNFSATFTAYSSTQQGENGPSGSQGNACPGAGVIAKASVTVVWQAQSTTTTTTTSPSTTTTTPPVTGTASFTATGDGKTVNGTGAQTKASAPTLSVPVGTTVGFMAESPSDATLTGIYSGLHNNPHEFQLCYSSGGCAASVTHSSSYQRRYRALYEAPSGFVLIGNINVDWVAPTTTTTTTTTTSPVSLSLIPPDPQIAPQPAHLLAKATNAPSGSTLEIVEGPTASAVASGSPHAIATCRAATCTATFVPQPANFGGTKFFRAILLNSPGRPHSSILPVTWGIVEPT